MLPWSLQEASPMLTEGFGALRTPQDGTWEDKGNFPQFRAHRRILLALSPWQLLPHLERVWWKGLMERV